MSISNVAQTITDTIIAKLEAGTKPWVQPWTGMPVSRPLRSCGEAYRGINTIMLWMAATISGYQSPYWFTYLQAQQIGGQVRKGSKASTAVFYKQLNSASRNDEVVGEAPEDGKSRRVLRAFSVFNADQIDGLPARFQPKPTAEPLPACEQRAALEAFFDRVGAETRHGGNAAYYEVRNDRIVLPVVESFSSYPSYCATRAHEIAHWTGAEHRLHRDFSGRFGTSAYAFEELVADIAAAIVGAALGLPEAMLDNHAAYVGSWLKVLKKDHRAILTAASQADTAADFILGLGQPGISTIVSYKDPLLKAA